MSTTISKYFAIFYNSNNFLLQKFLCLDDIRDSSTPQRGAIFQFFKANKTVHENQFLR